MTTISRQATCTGPVIRWQIRRSFQTSKFQALFPMELLLEFGERPTRSKKCLWGSQRETSTIVGVMAHRSVLNNHLFNGFIRTEQSEATPAFFSMRTTLSLAIRRALRIMKSCTTYEESCRG